MKCFNCGKKFDYEKYYGICPKCGSFNREETAQEQHQRYHEEYDNGYQHPVHTHTGYGETSQSKEAPSGHQGNAGSPYMQVREVKERSSRGSTIFLIVSIVIFVAVTFGFTAFGFLYGRGQEKQLLREVEETEPDQLAHAVGETFTIQGMRLTIEEAWIVDQGRERNPYLPEGKKLVAVKLLGESDGEWADKNRLSTAYIKSEGLYYEQMSAYEAEGNGKEGTFYDIPLFESSSLCMEQETEGCILFWVGEEQQDFTLCLEERTGQDLIFIEAIHTIELHLEEAYEGGQDHEQGN